MAVILWSHKCNMEEYSLKHMSTGCAIAGRPNSMGQGRAMGVCYGHQGSRTHLYMIPRAAAKMNTVRKMANSALRQPGSCTLPDMEKQPTLEWYAHIRLCRPSQYP